MDDAYLSPNTSAFTACEGARIGRRYFPSKGRWAFGGTNCHLFLHLLIRASVCVCMWWVRGDPLELGGLAGVLTVPSLVTLTGTTRVSGCSDCAVTGDPDWDYEG